MLTLVYALCRREQLADIQRNGVARSKLKLWLTEDLALKTSFSHVANETLEQGVVLYVLMGDLAHTVTEKGCVMLDHCTHIPPSRIGILKVISAGNRTTSKGGRTADMMSAEERQRRSEGAKKARATRKAKTLGDFVIPTL